MKNEENKTEVVVEDESGQEEISPQDESQDVDIESSQEEETPIELSEEKDDSEPARSELDVERDKRLRILAEYDNFRRRTQTDFQRVIARASERMISGLLPALDDFERLLNHDMDGITLESFREGADLIHKKIVTVFLAEGLEPIETLGKLFDPEIHEALTQMENSDEPDGIILEEIEKGYRLSGSILRHAKVIVNRRSDDEGVK